MWILGLNGLIGSFSIDEGESTVFFENPVESLLSTWVFKTPDFFFNQKLFLFDFLRSDTVILPRFFEPSIFRNFWTNSASFQKLTFDFSKSLKIQEPTKPHLATCTTWEWVIYERVTKKLQRCCYTIKNHLRFCWEEFPRWKDELITCYFGWVKKEKFWSRRLSCQSKGPASPGIFYLKNTICKEMPRRETGQY